MPRDGHLALSLKIKLAAYNQGQSAVSPSQSPYFQFKLEMALWSVLSEAAGGGGGEAGGGRGGE